MLRFALGSRPIKLCAKNTRANVEGDYSAYSKMNRVESYLVHRDRVFSAISPRDLEDSHFIVAARVCLDGKAFVTAVSPFGSLEIGHRRFIRPKSIDESWIKFNFFHAVNYERLTYPASLIGKHAIIESVRDDYIEKIRQLCSFDGHGREAIEKATSETRGVTLERMRQDYEEEIDLLLEMLERIEYVDKHGIDAAIKISVDSLTWMGSSFTLLIDDDPTHASNLIALLAWPAIRHMIKSVVAVSGLKVPGRRAKELKNASGDYIAFQMYPNIDGTIGEKFRSMKSGTARVSVNSLFGAASGGFSHRVLNPNNGSTFHVYERVAVVAGRKPNYRQAYEGHKAADSVFAQLTGIKGYSPLLYTDFHRDGVQGGLEFLSGKIGRYVPRSLRETGEILYDHTSSFPLYTPPGGGVPLVENYKHDKLFLNFSAIEYMYAIINTERTGPIEFHEVTSMARLLRS